MENKTLIYDVEENPKKKSEWFLFAIQHILAMLVACITVPSLTGLPIGSTLVSAGIGTIIYILITKKKSPVFLSSSFAYLNAMFSGLAVGVSKSVIDSYGDFVSFGQSGHANYAAVMLGMAFVGLVYVIIALIIKKTGTRWLNKLLPPVVVGPVIMVIGLSLAGVSAVPNVMGGTYAISKLGCNAWYDTLLSTGVALVACFVTAFVAVKGNKTFRLIPFVIGMFSAYLLALVLSLIGLLAEVPSLQIINLNMFTEVKWNTLGAWLNVSSSDWMFTLALNSDAAFNIAVVGQVAILFIPVALVTICEHIGDHKNLGNIIGRDLLEEEPGMTRTLIGDGLATAVSGSLCGAANTTYGENVAVVGVTRIASVNVILLAAVMAIGFGFFAPLTLVLSSVPSCITGGVSLILYGFIASSGVKMLIKEKVDFNKTKNIIVASVILVSGIGGLTFVFGSGNSAITVTSTAVSMLLGIFFNFILKDEEKDVEQEEKEEVVQEENVASKE
ncbi:MAG: solute carrier family 23 protein [Bacilli bacterium]|nr:solute carrier family 23 protein [Bacilli bacterium]